MADGIITCGISLLGKSLATVSILNMTLQVDKIPQIGKSFCRQVHRHYTL